MMQIWDILQLKMALEDILLNSLSYIVEDQSSQIIWKGKRFF